MKSQFRISCFVLLGIAWLWTGHAAGQTVLYDSHGKRDPFLDLKSTSTRPQPPRVPAPPPLEKRPPGLAGLLIAEVTVTGTASGSGTQIVILKGIDEVSYFAREGTKLFDGFLETIAGDEVVFVQIQTDTRGTERKAKVTKRTQTEER